MNLYISCPVRTDYPSSQGLKDRILKVAHNDTCSDTSAVYHVLVLLGVVWFVDL